MQGDGSLSLYFRAYAWQWGGYNGIGGKLFDCGESPNTTCLSWMGDKERKPDDDLYPFNILWINDDHDLAVQYSCSEMMMGLFSYQWWGVISKNQAADAETL
jgi:hypothetical protein